MSAPQLRSWYRVAVAFLFLALSGLPGALATPFIWNVKQAVQNIGTVSANVIKINDQWPPEPIEVNVGDVFQIIVTNTDVTEGITLHGHGLHQLNNNEYDGPEGITQCPIMPGDTFTYNWSADVAGTFWIHSHKKGQYPYGIRTPLIVKNASEPSYYGYDADKDITLDMADFWLNMAEADTKYSNDQCVDINNNQNGFLAPAPDLAYIRDQTNPVFDLTTSPHTPVTGTTGIRVRLINMSAYNTFIVFSSDSSMQFRVIEVDGVALTAPPSGSGGRWATSLEIHPGQRYSILIKPGSWSNFKLYTVIDANHYAGNTCSPQSGNALTATASFKMQAGNSNIPSLTFSTPITACPDSSRPCFYKNTVTNKIELTNLPVFANYLQTGRVNDTWYWSDFVPKSSVNRLVWNDANSVLITVDLKADGSGEANMNDAHFTLPTLPLMIDNLVRGHSYYKPNVWWIDQDTQVFLIVRSFIGNHPFHLHGHDFQVLYHETVADPNWSWPRSLDEAKLKANQYNQPPFPVRRDTIVIPSKTYSLLAFKANNPGVWFMHCHNDFHAKSGMAGAFVVVPQATSSWNKVQAGTTITNQCHLPVSRLFRA